MLTENIHRYLSINLIIHADIVTICYICCLLLHLHQHATSPLPDSHVSLDNSTVTPKCHKQLDLISTALSLYRSRYQFNPLLSHHLLEWKETLHLEVWQVNNARISSVHRYSLYESGYCIWTHEIPPSQYNHLYWLIEISDDLYSMWGIPAVD